MSMIGNTRPDPRESVRRFIQTDPLAQRRNDFSGTFEQATVPLQEPMSASEQAYGNQDLFAERLQEAEQMGLAATESAVQLAQRREQEFLRQKAAETAQQQQAYTGQGTTSGSFASSEQGNFDVPGNLEGTRREVMQRAGQYIGSPYQLGGKTVKGIDCSGLVMAVYGQAGIDVSQHSAGWQGRNIPGARTSVNNLQPGDIVAWKDGSHIAIYAGNGMIIDASSRGGTRQRPLWAPQNQVYGIKLRFPGE